jgi:hypothetical protein
VADHLFGDVHLDEVPAVVHEERMPDELRRDRRTAGPRLDRLLAPGGIEPRELLQDVLVDVRAFFE